MSGKYSIDSRIFPYLEQHGRDTLSVEFARFAFDIDELNLPVTFSGSTQKLIEFTRNSRTTTHVEVREVCNPYVRHCGMFDFKSTQAFDFVVKLMHAIKSIKYNPLYWEIWFALNEKVDLWEHVSVYSGDTRNILVVGKGSAPFITTSENISETFLMRNIQKRLDVVGDTEKEIFINFMKEYTKAGE